MSIIATIYTTVPSVPFGAIRAPCGKFQEAAKGPGIRDGPRLDERRGNREQRAKNKSARQQGETIRGQQARQGHRNGEAQVQNRSGAWRAGGWAVLQLSHTDSTFMGCHSWTEKHAAHAMAGGDGDLWQSSRAAKGGGGGGGARPLAQPRRSALRRCFGGVPASCRCRRPRTAAAARRVCPVEARRWSSAAPPRRGSCPPAPLGRTAGLCGGARGSLCSLSARCCVLRRAATVWQAADAGRRAASSSGDARSSVNSLKRSGLCA